MRLPFFVAGLWLAGSILLHADARPPLSSDEMAAIASTLKWQTGTVTLRDGLANAKQVEDFWHALYV